MGKCVKIEMDDAGNFSVGLDPDYGKEGAEAAGATAGAPGAPAAAAPDAGNPFAPAAAPAGAAAPGEEQQEAPMQPARNLDDALKQAKALLEEPTDENGNSPFEQGFASARGPMSGMPGMEA